MHNVTEKEIQEASAAFEEYITDFMAEALEKKHARDMANEGIDDHHDAAPFTKCENDCLI